MGCQARVGLAQSVPHSLSGNQTERRGRFETPQAVAVFTRREEEEEEEEEERRGGGGIVGERAAAVFHRTSHKNRLLRPLYREDIILPRGGRLHSTCRAVGWGRARQRRALAPASACFDSTSTHTQPASGGSGNDVATAARVRVSPPLTTANGRKGDEICRDSAQLYKQGTSLARHVWAALSLSSPRSTESAHPGAA